MYFEECESLVSEQPDAAGVIEFLDKYIEHQGIGALLVPELLVACAEECNLRAEQVPSALDLLSQKGLLYIEEVVECESCGMFTLWSDVEKAINEHETLECSDCGEDIMKQQCARQPCYRSAKGTHSLGEKVEEHVAYQRNQPVAKPTTNATVRILHLSDLHFQSSSDLDTVLLPLINDLNEIGGGIDAVVITGDFTDHASPEEFDKAKIFVVCLLQNLRLQPSSCVIVPGNHDVYWDPEVYRPTVTKPSNINDEHYVIDDRVILKRDDEKYPARFDNFSTYLYEPLFGLPYQHEFEDQCIPYIIPNTDIQILAANSVWQIDNYYPDRAGIHLTALLRGLRNAEVQAVNMAIFRICVFHDPATGNDKMPDETYLEHLGKARIRLCLHGDIHEDRNDLVNPIESRKSIWVVGVGAFGASASARPESTPRIYNILEISADRANVKVHSRSCGKSGGAWEPHCIWPSADGNPSVRQAYYDISITK
ncbi:MAG: metallophosphoesterase [Armatimonadota bacterium]|nr:metallophosphoesterase [bacterium]